MKCKILEGMFYNIEAFEREIKEFLEDGWKPSGNISTSGNKLYLLMLKEE